MSVKCHEIKGKCHEMNGKMSQNEWEMSWNEGKMSWHEWENVSKYAWNVMKWGENVMKWMGISLICEMFSWWREVGYLVVLQGKGFQIAWTVFFFVFMLWRYKCRFWSCLICEMFFNWREAGVLVVLQGKVFQIAWNFECSLNDVRLVILLRWKCGFWSCLICEMFSYWREAGYLVVLQGEVFQIAWTVFFFVFMLGACKISAINRFLLEGNLFFFILKRANEWCLCGWCQWVNGSYVSGQLVMGQKSEKMGTCMPSHM